MKYVILQRQVDDLKYNFPVIFPSQLVHADIAKTIKQVEGLEDCYVVSAGDASITAKCSGASTTLDVESRDMDSFLVSNNDYLYGMDEDSIGMLPPSVLELLIENASE